MRTVIKYSEMDKRLLEENESRANEGSAPLENYIPTDEMVELVNDYIMDDRSRAGLPVPTLMEHLTPSNYEDDNDRETAEAMICMNDYIGSIPPHLNIKNVRLTPDGMEVKVTIGDD